MGLKDKKYYIKWLSQLKDQIYHLVQINVIGHDINRIILANDDLSKSSPLWTYLDNSFVCNVIVNLAKVIEPQKSHYKDDRSFHCFLKELDPCFVLSETQYVKLCSMNKSDFIGDAWTEKMIKEECEERDAKMAERYKSITCEKRPEEIIKYDINSLENMYNKFSKFRKYKVAHMNDYEQIGEIDKITYQDITDAIEVLKNLAIKYSILLDGSRPVYFDYKPKYDNVFEIAWVKS